MNRTNSKSEQPRRSAYGFAEPERGQPLLKEGWGRIRGLISRLLRFDVEVRNSANKIVVQLPLIAVLVGCLLAPAVAVLAFIAGLVLRYRMQLIRRTPS
ncbi:MAG: DUF4342 domain-containing protein [Candidatus Margulisiibacteriota bacterium]